MKAGAAIAATSIVGLGLATIGAGPAVAADVTDPCDTAYDHLPGGSTVADNWYMPCVPQFGLGKVEFNVDSDVDFPTGFASLDDPSVTSASANTGPNATTYMGSTSTIAGFTALTETDAQPRQRSYEGLMMFAISSVSKIEVSDLPAACGSGPYQTAFQVNYLPATVTFTQTVDGVEWTVVVTYTPSPLFLGLNFDDGDPINFDGDQVQCASSTTGTTVALPDDSFAHLLVLGVHASFIELSNSIVGTISPFPTSDLDNGNPVGLLGSFAAKTPQLAETGVESSGLGLAGTLAVFIGAMLLFFRRKRKGEHA